MLAHHRFLYDGMERRGLERNSAFVPDLWIGVWIGMSASPCSGPIIMSGSHTSIYIYSKG